MGFSKRSYFVDGRSENNTVSLVPQAGAKIIISSIKSRAIQMSLGTNQSSGNILYFLHADVTLIESFATDIYETILSGCPAGCYRYQLDSKSWQLKANAYYTRFNGIMCGGRIRHYSSIRLSLNP
ncbi:MAG: hypothetical protein KF860_00070 [Cyclobacteriaceae bacterium]|nr:hypothetical protein [Cyclobacteriaceae bacterium]